MTAKKNEGPQTIDAADFVLDSGAILPDTKLVYATFGTLNEARDNVIIMPTHYGGTHENSLYLIG